MITRASQLLLLLCLLAALPPAAPAAAAGDDGFADAAFRARWTRVDSPVEGGAAQRSWTWGARPGERRYERYDQSPGGARLVQYFDKARMEISDPAGDRSSPWFVTGGLLVAELIGGRIPLGQGQAEHRTPADIPIAGDPAANPDAPTYATLAAIASFDGSNRAASRTGARVDASYGPSGVGRRPELALPETELVAYQSATGHNVPRVFQEFMAASGPVLEGGRTRRGQIVDPLFAFGYPITEPYWARARIGGVPTDVLFQAFERRVLTYTPSNSPGWRVEMGNVGQHYFQWRYRRPLRYALPALPEGVRSRETSVTIPTYDYAAALLPTAPGDPIYPYPLLDRARVGPPRPVAYRALVVENRFLELTFLPELGGRLYQAIDKATGHNIFYRNPVVKPSPFGQRGWWLGVGGLEWAAPTEEHGYLEYLPWDMTLAKGAGELSVRLTATERQSGLGLAGTVRLAADEGRFHVLMQASNPTPAAHPLQMWTSATLSPGGASAIGPGIRLAVPSDRMIVHATEDRALPGPGGWIVWPSDGSRDLSRPASWSGYLGAFSPWPVAFLGVYETSLDEGAAVVHGPGVAGAKVFGFSDHFDRQVFTDGDSSYVELWSGAQLTFWDHPQLASGASRAIEADWLPLWGLGDLAGAAAEGALGTQARPDGGRTVTLASARVVRGAVVVVRVSGQEVFRSAPLDLRPDQPLAIDLPPGAPRGPVRVEAPGLALQAP